MTPLAVWFGELQASRWLAAEKISCAQLSSQLLAGHTVQFELSSRVPDFFSISPAVFQHRIQVDADGGLHGACLGHGDELPLSSNSVQFLVSHHSHELGHRLDSRLSEWNRVLAVSGILILIGFSALGRSCSAPFDGLQRLRPDQLSKKLREVGLAPQRARAVLLPDSRIDRALERIQSAWPVTESWVAGLAAGYVMSARKLDTAGPDLNVRRLRFGQIKHRVQGTATS